MTDQLSAAERAYTHTKDMIIRGELAGGSLLSEASIGADLGISRTPVHEAFLRLAAERLITLSSRRGAIVVPMNPRESSDVLEMREAIEGSAATTATAAPSTELTARLDELLADQRRCAASGDVDGFVAADDAFHTTIVEASRNDIAGHFFALLRDRQQRVRHQLFAVDPGQLAMSLREHEELRDAVVSRSADGYREILHRHIARNQGVL
ncbi:GntR family transcriptional regulator [Spelaeicoccus albus]|uniref:DNA-binding GntR family transcriptional regulator n=1 Tax=Spelaeicoccus albus TaxID=1280376 RepID=A0A7Z0A8U2_9MICO|nr:GntR family transcriptional regulator [Spelaeicoccus albus]NYI66514.1 DNA-binding GntR family transcriptional regulator [Spelaeicoccus albus]